MKKELAKQKFCLLLYNNIEIWLDVEKWDALDSALSDGKNKFIKIQERHGLINVNHVIGTFSAQEMEETIRRKNGQWQCKIATIWHDRGKKCECIDPEVAKRLKLEQERKLQSQQKQMTPEDFKRRQEIMTNLRKVLFK